MKRRTRIKRILQTAPLVLFVITCSVLLAYGLRALQRSMQTDDMDRRELQYDADDDFVMIDTQNALIGVYHATRPLRHAWKDRLRQIPPGTYYLSICDGWLELWNHEMRGVYVIWTTEDENRFFLRTIKQDIPVLVY